MSLIETKTHLVQLLSDRDNKVIALSGKWGTGKSHLWREVKNASPDEQVKNALYVSLFGLTSIDQVKLKIVQSSIPKAGENPAWWDQAKKGWAAASKLLESVHKGFGALNEIALLAIPSMLKDRVIVLDDIERKHEKLSVDEVMGFIDEFTQQHGSRMVLILNSDKLADQAIWDTLREKVIDQELRLETTPNEALEIALAIAPTPYAARIRPTVEACGLTNIRIICKVIKALNRVLSGQGQLSDEVLSRVVPSTALLAATHFKGLENGPDFEFILNFGNPNDFGDYGKKAEDLDEAGKMRAKWRVMLSELGINGCDEYEMLVVDFLKSGLFNVAAVQGIIERYSREADVMHAITLSRAFHDHVLWHHTMSDGELLGEAAELVPLVPLLDMYAATSLFDHVSKIPGGAAIAAALIKAWIDRFEERSIQGMDFDSFWNHPLHPDIKAAIDAAKARSQSHATIFDACSVIVNNRGWGRKQEAVLKAATVADFEATIRTLAIEDFKLFMSGFVDMCVHSQTYKAHFGSATENFLAACRNIRNDPTVPRLGATIENILRSSHLESHLIEPTVTQTGEPPVDADE
jgi:hypothetical protein